MKPKAGKIARSARKLATKGTGKRWKKGQSSSSNPTANTHREAAKNRFFNVNLGPSTLTVDALQQHNQSEYGDDNNKGATIFSELDDHSQSARTFSTWASNWTDCTNMTFNKVHRYWSSNNDFHKEVLAVLAAVTEVIKENGGTESETEYFAALISSLETVDSDESMAAIVYLLSLVIKKVPSEVLKSQFSNVAKKLMEYLEQHSNTDCTSLLKSLLKCLATLLRAQDPATWSEPSTCHIYNTLLAYSVHPKPKVRKEAHQCVCSVLKGSQFMLREEGPAHSATSPAQPTTSPAHHPAASQTAKYCVQTLEEHGAGKTSSSLHILGLLKDILGVLPKSGVKAVCETVLRLMTLSDVVTKSVCMQALHGLFLSRPKPTSLTAELNAQIIVALYDYRPGSNDSQPLSAWLAVITQAHINLARLDAALCVSHLPRLVSTCMQCMLAEREDGVQASADTIRREIGFFDVRRKNYLDSLSVKEKFIGLLFRRRMMKLFVNFLVLVVLYKQGSAENDPGIKPDAHQPQGLPELSEDIAETLQNLENSELSDSVAEAAADAQKILDSIANPELYEKWADAKIEDFPDLEEDTDASTLEELGILGFNGTVEEYLKSFISEEDFEVPDLDDDVEEKTVTFRNAKKDDDLLLTDDQADWLFSPDYENKTKSSGRRTYAGTQVKGVRFWPNGVVHYVIQRDHFRQEERRAIRNAMKVWEKYTCLRFVKWTNEPNFVYIHHTDDGCYSLLGMAGGQQPLSLQGPGCRHFGTYLHELGHAVGLVHEHQLPTRNNYVRFYSSNVDPKQLVIEECLAPNIEHVKKSMPAKSGSPIGKIYQALEAGLSYQYHNAWGRVLNAISSLIQVLGKDYHNIMTKSLVTMADLRESHRFSYKPEVDYAFSTAVEVLGPRLVLGAVPLLINGDEKDNLDFPRSWLMPILSDSIRDTELSYFIDYFLPLAARIKDRATKLASEGTNAGAKTYEILHYQVWSLLPGFCTRPTDFRQSFKNLAKTLGTAIQTKSDLQLGCMASLRKLILQNKDHEENREELARFAKNYLPILFNLYSTDPDKLKDPVRLASLETIKFYVQITPDELLSSFYDRAFAKLNDESTVAFTRHALMDLVNAMLPYVTAGRLESLYAWIVPNLKSKDRTTQKKAYRSLEELCGASGATCRQFVASRLPELKTILAESLSTAHASSKAPRLRCLINLFRNLEQGDMTFIQTVIPEAILCTKESAERARAAAYLLLIEMCESGARWLRAPKHETVLEYFKFVATGLEEKPHHVSTTLLALTRLLFHYRADASPPLLELLCTKLSELLASKAREIVEAAIGLLKVMLGSFREVELAKYLQEMVGGLVSMKDDNRHHFRFKAKEVFERLIRKFGYDTIRKMVPESHHKLINNIRKTQERVKRQKKQHGGDEEEEDYQDEFRKKSMPESLEDFLKDSDLELEDHEPETKRPKAKVKREKGGKAWLKEGDENDLVDFLDKSAAQKIMATQPAGGASESGIVKHDFKTAADGRLIITMDDSDDEEKKEKKSDIKADEIMEAMEMRTGKFRKRRRDAVPEDDDEPAMKYKPGGSGIHRPIAMATKKQDAASKHQDRMNKMKVSGDEYKAKKAKGDVKRKGKPDPYAYVPLNLSSLNRRKQAKFKGQFSNLVKGARKGAMAGRKSKAKKRK